jgi:hypothetical protein
MVHCGDHECPIPGQSGDHLTAYEGIPVDLLWKVLTHLGTDIDIGGEPMSWIPARKRLPTHMRVDRCAIPTRFGVKSASKFD